MSPVRDQIKRDIRLALDRGGQGKVLYLEGRSDPPVFFGVLGVSPIPLPETVAGTIRHG